MDFCDLGNCANGHRGQFDERHRVLQMLGGLVTITSTAPVLSAAGITAPSYAEVLDYLQTQYRTIYGADSYLEPDSQDGQFLGIIAAAINDANGAATAVFNAFSPATAQGTGLASVLKGNGIKPAIATNSTVSLTITGTAGTAIVNGLVGDASQNKWALPTPVNIPDSSTITVTATCTVAGAVGAPAATVTRILTPQLGWQSVTQPSAAVLGAPVETDAALRQRQSVSVAPAAQAPLVAIIGAVAALPGVTRYTGFENPTGTTDANGLPPHSVAIIVEGGVLADIATAIANTKSVGVLTYGTTTQTVTNIYGLPSTINFFLVTEKRTTVAISLTPINGYSAAIGAEIQASVAAYINSLAIGEKIRYTRLFGPATLGGVGDGLSYEIITLGVSLYPASPGVIDAPIAFNEAANCQPSDVVLTLV